jgi:succinate dehydrogenase / fumarate reductase membrane anchor subunit
MKESTYWLLHFTAAMVMLIVMPIHLAIFSSLIGTGYVEGLKYENVILRARAQSLALMYIVFLIAALYHGMYGLRSMMLELSFSERLEKLISLLCLSIGAAAFVYGTYIILIGYLA